MGATPVGGTKGRGCMKTLICHCEQCLGTRKHTRKRNRVQTYQVRAARSKNKRLLKTLTIEEIEDTLPQVVSVDYYA